MIARDYAKALYALKEGATIRGLKASLQKNKHQKLLPQIYAEYQKLLLQERRLKVHKKVTPEQERTRTLLALYRKLTHV